jgi:hypothetical protein
MRFVWEAGPPGSLEKGEEGHEQGDGVGMVPLLWFLTRPTSTSHAPGVLEMASTVCRSAEEASSRSTTTALARAARSPWERTEMRVLRERTR